MLRARMQGSEPAWVRERTASGLIVYDRESVTLQGDPPEERKVISGIPITNGMTLSIYGSPEKPGGFGQPCGGFRIDSPNGHSCELVLGAFGSNGFVRMNFDHVNPGGQFNPQGVAMNEKNWNGKMVFDAPNSLRAWVTNLTVIAPFPVWNGVRPDAFSMNDTADITCVCHWLTAGAPPHGTSKDFSVCKKNTLELRGLPLGGSVRFTPSGTIVRPASVVNVDGAGSALWEAQYSVWPLAMLAEVYDGANATGNLIRSWQLPFVFGGDVFTWNRP